MDSRIRLILLTVISSVVIISCKKTPDWVLDKDDMASLLIDIHKGESVIEYERSRYYNDSLKKVMKQSIYARHGVTAEMVDTSFVWYGNHIEDYLEVYDVVIDRLENELNQSNSSVDVPVFAAGDSIDVWAGSPRYRINYSIPLRNIAFSASVDENSEAGDNYMLQFKIMNPRTVPSKVKAGLYAEYDGGIIESKTGTATNEGWLRVRLVTDSTKTIKSVYGNISFGVSEGESFYIDSLSFVRTRKNAVTYIQRGGQRHFEVNSRVDVE